MIATEQNLQNEIKNLSQTVLTNSLLIVCRIGPDKRRKLEDAIERYQEMSQYKALIGTIEYNDTVRTIKDILGFDIDKFPIGL